jgi:uncharacterized membrane protein YfcA
VTLARALFLTGLVARERHEVALSGATRVLALSIGAVLGFVLGVTSVGSGALVGLALILVFRLLPHRVVGTDVFHAALMLWAAGLAQVALGHVDYGLMGTILIGSLPGVWIGERLVHRVPAAVLRPTLGCVLLGSALGVLSKAGASLSAWAILGPPVLVGVAAWALHRARRGSAREAVVAA